MPNDMQARLERQEELLDSIESRLLSLASKQGRSADDMRLYVRELREWIADKRADR